MPTQIRCRMTTWPLWCQNCKKDQPRLCWDYDLEKQTCEECGLILDFQPDTRGSAPGIATDDIPGGLAIKHGLCNEDGSPKVYYSKSDIKREANRRGLTILGDTPKPYKVNWDGKRIRRPDERYDQNFNPER